MKVSITGANGFLGRNLASFLEKKGFKVLRVQRTKDIGTINIPDCSKNTNWSEALVGVDTLIHCASVVHQFKKTSFEYYYQVNVQGTESLLRQAAKFGVKKFIFISTIKVNGESSSKEEPFSSASDPNPHDNYSISKLLAESSIKQISQELGIKFVIIRPCLIYGPGVKANFYKLIKIIDFGIPLPFKNVNNERSILFIDNICGFIFNIIKNDKFLNKTYLLADQKSISLANLINMISKNLRKTNVNFRVSLKLLSFIFKLFGKKDIAQRLMGSLVIDSFNSYKEIGFEKPLSTEEGIHETIKWYLKKTKKL